jgi:DNA-binding transcriptional ArsR family regulator
VTTYADVLDVLADATRRSIVERLRAGPLPVAALAADLPVSRPAVSQHLRVLRDAGLVTFEPAGTRNVYRLRPAGIGPLRDWLDEFWQAPLDAFRDHVAAAGGGPDTDADAVGTSEPGAAPGTHRDPRSEP